MTDHQGRDYGLFGPGSVTWRVASEPVMWIAGVRAMYIQALHPKVMLGTWQNTAFAKPDEAWGRFTRTVEFVRVRTYGSTAEVDRAAARLRKVHASLSGVDADGTTFRLNDPELLLWVHCGEIGSYAEIARRSGVHVTPAELDTFVAEQRRSAEVVGLSQHPLHNRPRPLVQLPISARLHVISPARAFRTRPTYPDSWGLSSVLDLLELRLIGGIQDGKTDRVETAKAGVWRVGQMKQVHIDLCRSTGDRQRWSDPSQLSATARSGSRRSLE